MPYISGLYYEEYGPAGAPPVILSAGLGGSGAYWAPNLEALAREHRVILYDHRGTGRSDRTLPRILIVPYMAADVLGLMDGLGLASASLIGHAAGGVIGLATAIEAPDRLDRLVIVNGWVAPDPHFARCMEARLALLEDSGVRAFVRAQPIFLYPARWISENDARLDQEEVEHIAQFQGAANLAARIAALLFFEIFEYDLAGIRAPTLLIAADDDMLVPSFCSDALAAGLPNATLARMTGGHACNITEPETFNSILCDWLGRVNLKGAA